MHYCIGDVHGCCDEMLSLLEKIEKQDRNARFIFIGDFVDRGEKVWETIEWAMENVTRDGKYQSVQGNHEQMVLQWYVSFCEWYKTKPNQTPPPEPNYDFMDCAKAKNKLNPTDLKPIMDFFSSLPLHKVISVPGKEGKPVTYDIVHAWYDYDEPEDSKQQYLDNLWRRETDGNFESDHVIIHGHTPTLSTFYLEHEHSAPGMIIYRKNAINIDGGCVFNRQVDNLPGLLCGICLETLEEFYSPTLKDRLSLTERLAYLKKYRSKSNPYRDELTKRLP